jgi:DNA-binding NarL/FixJ family response regulator
MKKIRVLLAEDHTIVRKGLRSILDAEDSVEVVGEAEDGRAAVEAVEHLRPDVVLMDISMPGLNGLEATRQIKRRAPHIRVLVLTMHTNEKYILQILQAGASGYLVKQAAVEELISAIQAVYRGDAFLSPSISKKVVQRYVQQGQVIAEEDSYELLTPREREVLQLIAEGHTNRDISRVLHISIKTVEVHRANLMKKLDLHSAAELTRYAIGKGIISPER